MTLNVNKCSVIRFSRHRLRKDCDDYEYRINNAPLKRVETIRDLGITLDRCLRFDTHFNAISAKALRMLGFILRNTREFKQSDTIILLYNALVRSSLEYCSVVWNPGYRVHIDRIERIQRKFLRILAYRQNVGYLRDYRSRLEHFKMTSLEDRRRMHDLVFLYKLINGVLDCPQLLNKLDIYVPTRIPRHGKYKPFAVKRSYTNLGSNSPINRLVREYNKLATSTLEIDIFSDKLTKFKKVIKINDSNDVV
ncbi:uncharacterized protein LOC123664948 [Melitaea cinxia]|uniref:uncharacterized protein LOC123664948 n=1 Tax=Melitaea cinxia TaxID=113334 RepID=UPI001E26FFB3|nr:uncharacterized protein LOC123664948 [Melitaea cinxia]